MSEETKNIGKKDEQTEQEVKPAELSEQELDNVAGAGVNNGKSGGIIGGTTGTS
jgi:hypothetical protein